MPIRQKFRKAREEKRSFWNITFKTNRLIESKGIYGIKENERKSNQK